MISPQNVRGAIAYFLALSLVCSPARALVSLNDGHDHVYVTGTMTLGWDSNIYANADAKSDYTVTSSLVAEYQRRAGWIGVNASVGVDSAKYNVFKSENFANPHFSLELTKQTGRTTGSFTLNAARQSRADAAVNVHSVSWNYNAGVNFKYPIVTIYTLSGQFGYSLIKYSRHSTGVEALAANPDGSQIDQTSGTTAPTPNAPFPDLATYTASLDLIRLLSTERDLTLGYRYRRSQTSLSSSYDDHDANIGLNGKLIRGVNGTLRAGYQVRIPHGFTTDGKPEPRFSSWTLAGSATYAMSKRMNVTGTISKDFSTTATDTSVDTTTGMVDVQYAYSSHWSLTSSASVGDSRFLGDSGRIVIALGPPLQLGPARHDQFVSADAGINYSLNEHFKVSASYAWFENWSNSSFADFVRSSYNLNVSSRW